MPNWQPDWTDVRFDHAAAADAVAELEATASLLVDTGEVLHRSAVDARDEWRGRYRENFDVEFAALDTEREQLVTALRMDAARIRGASEGARFEQRRRESERERWNSENRAEQEAAERARQEAARQEAAQQEAARQEELARRTTQPVDQAA